MMSNQKKVAIIGIVFTILCISTTYWYLSATAQGTMVIQGTTIQGTKLIVPEGLGTTGFGTALTFNSVTYHFMKEEQTSLIKDTLQKVSCLSVFIGGFSIGDFQSFQNPKIGQVFTFKSIQITIAEIHSDRYVIYVKSID